MKRLNLIVQQTPRKCRNIFINNHIKRHFTKTPKVMTNSYQQYNPTTGEFLQGYDMISKNDLENLLEKSFSNQKKFAELEWKERSNAAYKMGDLLIKHKKELASILVKELGKPINQALGEVQKCADMCHYFSQLKAKHHFETGLKKVAGMEELNVEITPLGLIFQIAPFNFPYWQVVRFAIPTLLTGNAIIMRHSKSTPESAEKLCDLFQQAGLPVTNLFLDHDQISDVIADRRVRGVAFTGSTQVGRVIAKQCGEHLKKHVLELGGADPFIVLEDADLDHAIKQAVTGRTQNNGQSCIAAKRFIVDERIMDDFIERFKGAFQKLKVGDPSSQSVDIGPLARKDLRDDLAEQVDEAVKEGASILYQGKVPSSYSNGYFYPPTILGNIDSSMKVYGAELFGPVAIVIPHKGPKDAIKIANSIDYGLGGQVFTKDVKLGKKIASQLECGMAFVNAFCRSFANAYVPFGGVKDSGYGKDNDLLEFVNIKTVGVGESL